MKNMQKKIDYKSLLKNEQPTIITIKNSCMFNYQDYKLLKDLSKYKIID